MTGPLRYGEPLTYGDIDDTGRPLAVCVHGFPDTPYTWRHLGPALVDGGYRVVAPWLPGYDGPVGHPVSVGTYVRRILETHRAHAGDERAVLIAHDWGAHASYGAVATAPDAFSRLVTLAVPPAAAIGPEMFRYRQLRRSFYFWLIQQVGLAETALLEPGFWEGLWADWSPGYDAADDIAVLRRHITADTIAEVVCPYRASLDEAHADPECAAEAAASLTPPRLPTLYLHGADDGAMGADILADPAAVLSHPGSVFTLVPGVGHFLHLEQPDAIWALIRDWLAD